MAVSADFTVSNRAADNYNTVVFTDASTGAITARKWILGDGTVVEGNDTTVRHTYLNPGRYTVTLVVQDAVDQDSETKVEYIVVNDVSPVPSFIIMQSLDETSGIYWRLYFDIDFHLVFENSSHIYRSKDKIADTSKWIFIQFDPMLEKMYYGTYLDYFREIEYNKSTNTTPIIPIDTKTEIAYQSTIKLDELMVWDSYKELNEYFKSTRGKAGYLDLS